MLTMESIAKTFAMVNTMQQSDGLFSLLRKEIQLSVGEYLSLLLQYEMHQFLGRTKYQRMIGGSKNYRNGGYDRSFTIKRLGTVKVKVPRDREGKYQTRILPRLKRYEDALRQDICYLYLSGMSTHSLSRLSSHLLGRSLSAAEVSRCSNEMKVALNAWRMRDLSQEAYQYLFVDGVCFKMRLQGRIQTIPLLVVLGVTREGQRKVLLLQAGDKESASSWREAFKDLKARGLRAEDIQLGIMDGLPGLEKVFQEELAHAKVQRCQVHVARNLLAKVLRSAKKEVADALRSIFYASSKSKARAFATQFVEKWKSQLPSAVHCLERSLESCLTYLDFPEEEWISLRTTNMIERPNKEFKRRTKPMEIVAGEIACYQLLGFIALKMEIHWKKTPLGKVSRSLPFFQNMIRREVA